MIFDKRKEGQSMLYYICSPYRGATKEEVEKHIGYAKELARTVLLHGFGVIAPHLYMPNCLDDSNSEERKRGLEASLEILKKCDVVYVGQKFGISEGMAAEIKEAEKLGISVFYRD